MQTDNRLFDDLSKLFNGIAGTVAGAGREAETQFRERMKTFLGGADFVGRDEFEAVKAIAVAAREEATALRARLDALEGRGGSADAPAAPAPFGDPAAS